MKMAGYLCPDRCIEAVRLAAQEQRIKMVECYDISKKPLEQQAAMLARLLSKKRGQAEDANGMVQPEEEGGKKPGNIRIELAEERMVIVKGADTVADAIELMKQAMAEAEDAKARKVTPRTFEAELRDRLAAGGKKAVADAEAKKKKAPAKAAEAERQRSKPADMAEAVA